MSDHDDETAANDLSRGFKIALAASIGVFLVVVAHLAAHLTVHGLHHGH